MPLPPRPLLQDAVRKVLGLPLPPRGDASSQAGWGDQSGRQKSRSRAPSGKFQHDLATRRLLSADEIKRALRHFRYNPEFRGEKRVPIKVLGEVCGLSRDTVHTAKRTGAMSHRTRAKLTWAIEAILDGRLHFRRRGQIWEVEGSIRPASSCAAPLGRRHNLLKILCTIIVHGVSQHGPGDYVRRCAPTPI
jgi:hypothetical protein